MERAASCWLFTPMAKIEIHFPDGTKLIHELTEEKVTVGRLPDNTIQIDEVSVSSHHAEITHEHDEYHVHDLGSTNGTFVNEEQVTHTKLEHGDDVRFGKVEAYYMEEDETGTSQPLPETKDVGIQPGESSRRPENFKNSSPFASEVKKSDPVAIAASILAVLSLLALGWAVFSVMSLQVA